MSTKSLTGVVIKMIDFDDDDSIVTIITHDDIISFIALGVRKLTSKNRVALQLGNLIEVEIFQARLRGKLSKLKKAVLIKQPPVEKADTALVILEVVKILQKLDKTSPMVLNRVMEGFAYLGEEFNHQVKTYVLFALLDVIGVFPRLDGCMECHRKDRILGFDFFKGGYTCVTHTKNKRSIEYLKGIKALTESMNNYKDTDALTNKLIYNELLAFIKENMFT